MSNQCDGMSELKIVYGSIQAKVKALKATLTDEQLVEYNKSIAESKQRFIDNHPECSSELLELLNQYYS